MPIYIYPLMGNGLTLLLVNVKCIFYEVAGDQSSQEKQDLLFWGIWKG